MSEDSAIVRLELDSRPECLTLVRSTLVGIGELVEFDPELIDDLKTAVSEACNNVVLHAYDGRPGPLAVQLRIAPEQVEVAVRDVGAGLQHAAHPEDRMGVGLAVISALADRAEFLTVPDGGTEVRMAFTGQRARSAVCGPAVLTGGPDPVEALLDLSGDVVVSLSPVALLPGALGRLVRAVAASARFSLDRFSDLYLLTDELAAHAQAAAEGEQISFAIAAENRRLELTIGPFRSGTSSRLEQRQSDRAGSRAPITLLADELTVEPNGDAEMVHITLIDGRREASHG